MAQDNPKGLRRNLTNYGDRGFALYLRRSFARSMGYSLEMLDRPIVGIAQTASGFNLMRQALGIKDLELPLLIPGISPRSGRKRR